MNDIQSPTITLLLRRWSRGDRAAAERLVPLVYDQLRHIAHRYFQRERRDHTLQTTALVHEVYLRLVLEPGVRWQSRSHFFGLAACMMRRVLIDYSRERAFQKRGGHLRKVPFEEVGELYRRPRPADLVALDDALLDLERVDPLKALIVELRFFGGLSVDETAECVGLSARSVARQWRLARAALYQALAQEARDAY